MIGFLIGTACVIGLIATARRARYGGACGHAYAYGGGYGGEDAPHEGPPYRGRGHGGWRGPGPGSRGFGGGFGWSPLAAFFERLEATPEQEHAVRDALDDLRKKGREARAAAEDARRSLGKVLREDTFDELALAEAQSRIDDAFDQTKKAAVDATAKLHGVLDARQRRILAELVEQGPRVLFGRHRGWRV